MKTKISLLIMIVSAVCVSSCSDDMKSYAEMKRDEKKAIDRLIATEGFEILNEYPADGVFGEKQFVLLDNGVYLNVVDSGNGNRAKLYTTTILMRCRVRFIFQEDTTLSLFSNDAFPIEFIYGYAANTISQDASAGTGSSIWYFLSTGVQSILEYVGENAEVKLIVPFEEGSSYQQANQLGAPLYYEKVKFMFY
ncbi:MAG: DUF4827 domain-containing protein [Tannerella sp.]|nr:DUF4827 domain-containing protein [Tannerella sp.]